MPVTAGERQAAEAAQRLLADPVLTEALNEIVAIETERAIVLSDRRARRDARMMVLAIGRLRTALEAAVAHVLGAEARETLEKSFEDVDPA